MEPNSVVSGHEVKEYKACLFTCLKRVLDVVGEEGDLVFGLMHLRAVLISLVEKSPERSTVSHLRGDVSGESLVRVDESPTADELSGDGICCYGPR